MDFVIVESPNTPGDSYRELQDRNFSEELILGDTDVIPERNRLNINDVDSIDLTEFVNEAQDNNTSTDRKNVKSLAFSIDNVSLFGLDDNHQLKDCKEEMQWKKDIVVSKSKVSRELHPIFYFKDGLCNWFFQLQFANVIIKGMFLILFSISIWSSYSVPPFYVSVAFAVLLIIYIKLCCSFIETGFLLSKVIFTFDFLFLCSLNAMGVSARIAQRWSDDQFVNFGLFFYVMFRFFWCTGILLSDCFIHWSRRERIFNYCLFVMDSIRIVVFNNFLYNDSLVTRENVCLYGNLFCLSLHTIQINGMFIFVFSSTFLELITVCIFFLKQVFADYKTLKTNQKPLFLIINSAIRIEVLSDSGINDALENVISPFQREKRSASTIHYFGRNFTGMTIFSDLNYLEANERMPFEPFLGFNMYRWISFKWVRIIVLFGALLPGLMLNKFDGVLNVSNFQISEILSCCGVMLGIVHLFAGFDRGIVKLLMFNFDAIYCLCVALIHVVCYIVVLIKSANNLAAYFSVDTPMIYAVGVIDVLLFGLLLSTLFLSDALIYWGRTLKFCVVAPLLIYFSYTIYGYFFLVPKLLNGDGSPVFETVSYCYRYFCIDLYSIIPQTLLIFACFLFKILFRFVFFPKSTVLLRARVSYEIIYNAAPDSSTNNYTLSL